MPPSPESAADTPFEEALARLEEIVRQLEDGQLGLSESLTRYEQGIRYLQQCHRALARAEQKIQLLTGIDSTGEPQTEPFEEENLNLPEKREARTRRRSQRTEVTDHDAASSDDPRPQRGLF